MYLEILYKVITFVLAQIPNWLGLQGSSLRKKKTSQ